MRKRLAGPIFQSRTDMAQEYGFKAFRLISTSGDCHLLDTGVACFVATVMLTPKADAYMHYSCDHT